MESRSRRSSPPANCKAVQSFPAFGAPFGGRLFLCVELRLDLAVELRRLETNARGVKTRLE
jgi:hypothetical protein